MAALAAKATVTGNPVRPAVIAAAAQPYPAPLDAGGPLHLLVFGGSQGARVMADIVPPAIETLTPELRARLGHHAAGAAGRSRARRRHLCASRRRAEVAPFFTDLPARIAALASDRVALRRLDGRRACGDRPARDPGAAAARARSGPARQRQCAGQGRRRDRAASRTISRPSGSPPRSPRSPPIRRSSPPWRPARNRPACSMPPTASPIWCCAWRMWIPAR